MSEEKFDLQGDKKEEVGGTRGCISLVLVIGIFLFVCLLSIQIITVFEQGAWFIPGDPENFDPILQYPEIEKYAGANVYLTMIRAQFVRRDGTLELAANYEPAPNVRYEFYRLTGTQSNAPAGVINPDAIAHRNVVVYISEPFNIPFIGRVSGSWAFQTMPGMDRTVYSEETSSVDESIPAPECHFSDLWTLAIETEEANPDAVAQILYDADGYNFRINGTSINIDFDFNCNIVD